MGRDGSRPSTTENHTSIDFMLYSGKVLYRLVSSTGLGLRVDMLYSIAYLTQYCTKTQWIFVNYLKKSH